MDHVSQVLCMGSQSTKGLAPVPFDACAATDVLHRSNRSAHAAMTACKAGMVIYQSKSFS